MHSSATLECLCIRLLPLVALLGWILCACSRCCRMYSISPPMFSTISGVVNSELAMAQQSNSSNRRHSKSSLAHKCFTAKIGISKG